VSQGSGADAPTLPDGLVAVVKRDCPTCVLVVPALQQLRDAGLPLTVYTQDDPAFPEGLGPVHDADLAVSWHHEIETVPTLIEVHDGVEVRRIVGWSRTEWQAFTEVDTLGTAAGTVLGTGPGTAAAGVELPEYRPGCGSLSVDPDLADELAVRFGGSVLRSRRIELAALEDDFEALFDRGWTDGLPVVPPTEARVLRMLEGTSLAPDHVVAVVPPDLVEVTVEKVAVNAVMAGCLPEHLPWVITAVQAICTDEFNIHGVLATTMPVGPVIVCSGPGTRAIGMNSGGNALGQGNRANLTIGRAVQLVVRNVGGGRPGEVDRAAHGNPGKLSFCFAEDEVGSPWTSLAEARGVAPGVDALTVFSGEGPRCVVDQLARDPEQLATSLAACLRTVHHPKLALIFDAMLVIGPEHARVFADAGWDRERVIAALHERLQLPGQEIVRGAGDMAEGMPEGFRDITLPKFRSEGILLVHAGGGAGLFSAIIAGWANGDIGSQPVTKPVVR
jgi:hypothetical protein